MSDFERHPASFRDPSGFLFRHQEKLYRAVMPPYRPSYEFLFESGLYESLVKQERLVEHREVEEIEGLEAELSGVYRILEPRPLPFVSYPYEWCFSQLREAALLTLRIQEEALAHGMSLRDASAYNVQFEGTRPLLIDTLSFEPYIEGRPWVAYGQFCRHFLAPLLLMAYRGVDLGRLSRLWIDGVPLALTSRLLPWHTRLRPSIYAHVHLHSRYESAYADEGGRAKEKRVSRLGLRGIVDNLRSLVEGLRYEPPSGVWVDYYDTHTYSGSAEEEKERLVGRFLHRLEPGSVWDLGANTGRYSLLASRRGAYTVSMDVDPGAVEHGFRAARRQDERSVLPLVMDLTNPSPALGWHHEERMSLLDRGPADLVLALALVHHLAIGNNVPLERVAALFARMGRYAVVELVPKGDVQVQRMLASREDIFEHYHEEGFEAAFGRLFEVLEKARLPESERVLYLLRRRG